MTLRCNALRKRPTSSLPRLYAKVICSRYQPSPSPSRAFSLHPSTPPRYFTCGELYLDEARAVYKEVLGNKKLSLPIGKMLFSPLTTWREIKAMGARTKEKGVEGNMAGEGIVKGGIPIVGPGGTDVIYSYAEETGSEIPIKEIEEALGKLAKSVQKA